MDISKSLSFVTEDQDWPAKLGLGALISLAPILNFAWTGYMVDIVRNVASYDSRPLPDWTDFGDKFLRGLLVSLALLIYALPVLIVMCLALTTAIAPAFFTGEEFVEELAAASGGVLVIAICCISLYALALTFITPAVLINFGRRGTFAACLHLGELLRIITANPGDYLLAWAASLGIGLAVGIALSFVSAVLSWIPCLGWIITLAASALGSVWASAVFAHLFGQVGARLDGVSLPAEL